RNPRILDKMAAKSQGTWCKNRPYMLSWKRGAAAALRHGPVSSAKETKYMPNRINYQQEMEKVLRRLEAEGTRPRLLLHACCAPCSSATLERLADHFDLTILYYR